MVEVKGHPLKKFLIKQFLPIGFVVAVAWALIWPQWGDALYHLVVDVGGIHFKLIPTINMIIIFLIFGVTLETTELKDAFRGWPSLIHGLLMILVVTSVTGFLPMWMDFVPPEFGMGLAIFACSPTSLSQGVTLVIQSYGNGALGLLLVVSSNLLAIFVSPIFVKLVLRSVPNANIEVIPLLVNLIVSILVPLVIAKVTRELFKSVIKFARTYKLPLYMFNNFQIIMIVWQTMSAAREKLFKQEPYDIIFAIMGAIGQHFFFLVLNMLIVWVVKKPEAERKALIIMCSQKSLPTAAAIINCLPPEIGDLGLMTIPCIVFYIMQLFIDSFIANSWAGKYERAQALYEKYAVELAELAKQEPDWASLATEAANKEAADTAAGSRSVGVDADTAAAGGTAEDLEKVGLLNNNATGGASTAAH